MKISKLRVTGLWAGNSQVTGEFPAHMASNGDIVSIWWRHHDIILINMSLKLIDSMYRMPVYTDLEIRMAYFT